MCVLTGLLFMFILVVPASIRCQLSYIFEYSGLYGSLNLRNPISHLRMFLTLTLDVDCLEQCYVCGSSLHRNLVRIP